MKKYRFILIILSTIILLNAFIVNAIGSLDSFKDVDGTQNSSKTISENAGVTTNRTIPEIIGLIIKTVIGLTGTVCLVIIVYSGVSIMFANGDKDRILKARNNMVPCIIGLAIVAASYAITDFIIKQISVVAA